MRALLVVAIVGLAAGCGGNAVTTDAFSVYDLESQRDVTGATKLHCAPQACSGGFAVVGKAKLSGTDVDRSSAAWEQDPQTGQPTVYLRFTPDGTRRFTQLTRELAHRGARSGRPQHFLLAVGKTVYAAPYIDYRVNPDGIPGDNGIQFSTATVAEAKRVVKLLRR